MMASLPEDKETRSPTPETLVDESRNVDNLNEKALESADAPIRDGKPVDNVDDEKAEEAEPIADEVEYASGIKLVFIVIALALSIFLVGLTFGLEPCLIRY